MSALVKSVMESEPEATMKVLLPPPPVSLSSPAPPVKVSLPVPPMRVSLRFEPVREVAPAVLVTLKPYEPFVVAARLTA